MLIEINEKELVMTEEGFLQNFSEWEPAIAEAIAEIDGVVLTEPHWNVIRFLRNYYEEYRIAPDLRTLYKMLDHDKRSSKAQMINLFGSSPANASCRYAGLPEPVRSGCP